MLLPLRGHFYHIFITGEAPQDPIKFETWVLKVSIWNNHKQNLCKCDVDSNLATFTKGGFKENIGYSGEDLVVGHCISYKL